MARYGPVYWQKHLEAWFQSELTQKAFCAQHGLSTKSFYRWLRKEKAAPAATESSLTLVPVSISGSATTGPVISFHSPGGWRIELLAALSGMINKDISVQLQIGQRAVENYRSRIHVKTVSVSLLELSHQAATAGITLDEIGLP
jgi:hypothetical protein